MKQDIVQISPKSLVSFPCSLMGAGLLCPFIDFEKEVALWKKKKKSQTKLGQDDEKEK